MQMSFLQHHHICSVRFDPFFIAQFEMQIYVLMEFYFQTYGWMWSGRIPGDLVAQWNQSSMLKPVTDTHVHTSLVGFPPDLFES